MQEKIIQQCVENYFLEDKIVMLDESLMRIKGIMFYIYDLIYFGNKIDPKMSSVRMGWYSYCGIGYS